MENREKGKSERRASGPLLIGAAAGCVFLSGFLIGYVTKNADKVASVSLYELCIGMDSPPSKRANLKERVECLERIDQMRDLFRKHSLGLPPAPSDAKSTNGED